MEETTNFALDAGSNEGFPLMTQKEVDVGKDTMWYLDSGESNHMYGHKYLFREIANIEDSHVSFRGHNLLCVEG